MIGVRTPQNDISNLAYLLIDTWGFADVEAAAAAIEVWVEYVNWSGPPADTSRWLVSGHSNGGKYCIHPLETYVPLTKSGQGTWYAVTHRPDKIIGAAVASGYSSIQSWLNPL